MTDAHIHPTRPTFQPIVWGLLVGALPPASPIVVRWIEPAILHALYLAFIAAIYIGFAVADGRPKIIAVESAVAAAFLILASVGVTESAWLLVAAYAAHGGPLTTPNAVRDRHPVVAPVLRRRRLPRGRDPRHRDRLGSVLPLTQPASDVRAVSRPSGDHQCPGSASTT